MADQPSVPPADWAPTPASAPVRAFEQDTSYDRPQRWRSPVLLTVIVACLVLVGGCTVIAAWLGASPGPGVTGAEADSGAETAAEADSGADPGTTRENPHPYDSPVELTWDVFGDADGSRWLITVGPPADITDEVLAANPFNEPPPERALFAGFDVELTLLEASNEPLAPGFNFTWEIVGAATARPYDHATIETGAFGCGVVDGGFDDFADTFVGGELAGTVCVPLPEDDLDHPDTLVALDFQGDHRIYFGSP